MRYVTGFPIGRRCASASRSAIRSPRCTAVIGALMALHHRDATGGPGKGEGQVVDVALYEAVFNMMESTLPEYDVFGVGARAHGQHSLPGIVPSNTYAAGTARRSWSPATATRSSSRLMTAIGRDDLADDPGLARNDGRVKRVAEIDGAIEAWCGQRPIDEALATLTTADVPVSRIYSVADMVSDAQFQARQMFEQAVLPDGTPMKVPAVVPKLSTTPGETRWLGPRLGEHTDHVLRELGYDVAAIKALRDEGVI